MTEPSLPAGMRANRPGRPGLTGTWFQAPGPAGGDRGVLRFNLAGAPAGAGQRLSAAVRAVNALDYSGFLPHGDIIQHENFLWLVTAQPASPTLVELARSGVRGVDVGSIATIVNETAQSLTELHGAGLSHGGISGDTVILTSTGAAKLAETSLLPALRGDQLEASVAAATDRRAWAELVRAMVVEWGGSGPGADLMRQVAAQGETDLSAAVQVLHAGAAMLPKGFSKRGALLTAVAAYSTMTANQNASVGTPPVSSPPVSPPAGTPPAAPGTQLAHDYQVSTPPGANPDEQQFATRLAKRAGAVQSARSPAAAPPMGTPVSGHPVSGQPVSPYPPGPYVPAQGLYQPGQARVAWPQAQPEEVRYGPGVGRGPTPSGGWQKPRRSPLKVIGSVLSALLTLVLLGYLGASVAGYTDNSTLQLMNFVTVKNIRLEIPSPGDKCDVRLVATGVFETDGKAGNINFQWEFPPQGDGPSAIYAGTVHASRGVTEVRTTASWQLTGVGTGNLVATLRLIKPGIGSTSATVRYNCKKQG